MIHVQKSYIIHVYKITYKITYGSRTKSHMIHATLSATLSRVQSRPRPIFSVSLKSHVILYSSLHSRK